MSEPIRVAVIDDHPIFLDGLERVLRRMKEVNLVAKGASAADALSIAAEHRPEIMLLDLTMPGGGFEAARAIRGAQPAIKIIVLTASDDHDKVATAIECGAQGFLTKGVVAAELLDAIKAVHRGQPYVTPAVSARFLMQRLRGQAVPNSSAKFNRRETEVLDLVAQGLSNQDIAERLSLALPTIKNYLTRIFAKLRVHSRTQAIAAWKREPS